MVAPVASPRLSTPCTVAWVALAAGLAACGGASPHAAGDVIGSSGSGALAPASPDVELRDAKSAIVAGRPVPMDGVAEGLAWPALGSVVHRGAHAVVVMAVGRDVPVSTVLRAVWTLRDADVRVQTSDTAGATQVIDLRPKPDVPNESGCHLAVFAMPNGDLRVAAPGGPRTIPGPDAPSALARALSKERAECTIRYVAFGADDANATWGSVFDVARAVDRDKSAGDARYVLGEAIH